MPATVYTRQLTATQLAALVALAKAHPIPEAGEDLVNALQTPVNGLQYRADLAKEFKTFAASADLGRGVRLTAGRDAYVQGVLDVLSFMGAVTFSDVSLVCGLARAGRLKQWLGA